MSAPARAYADEKAECLQAHVDGQVAQRSGRLREAAARYAICTRPLCPGTVQKECFDLLSRAEGDLASIVVDATDDGRPIDHVKVVVDGITLAETTAAPIAVDPRESVVRFEVEGGRFLEQRVIFVRGEKGRHLTAAFKTAVGPAPKVVTAPAVPAPPPADSAPQPPPTKAPILSYVLGGVAVVGVGTFAAFGFAGKARESELERCAPTCGSRTVDVMYERYLVADIALGIGVLAAGAATILFLLR